MECCDDVGDERRNLSCILILQIYIDIDSKPAFVNLFLLPHSNLTIFVRMCSVRNVNMYLHYSSLMIGFSNISCLDCMIQ